jgi:hypothetical protein
LKYVEDFSGPSTTPVMANPCPDHDIQRRWFPKVDHAVQSALARNLDPSKWAATKLITLHLNITKEEAE